MGHSHSEPHISPLSLYFKVFGSLIVLTFVTVGVSYLGMPATPSIIVAMAVASVKASLVAAWFMHLLHDTKFNIGLFLASIWFIGAFFCFTSIDLMSRDRIMKSGGNFEFRKENAALQAQISKADMQKNHWKNEKGELQTIFFTSDGFVDVNGDAVDPLSIAH